MQLHDVNHVSHVTRIFITCKLKATTLFQGSTCIIIIIHSTTSYVAKPGKWGWGGKRALLITMCICPYMVIPHLKIKIALLICNSQNYCSYDLYVSW